MCNLLYGAETDCIEKVVYYVGGNELKFYRYFEDSSADFRHVIINGKNVDKISIPLSDYFSLRGVYICAQQELGKRGR